MAMRLTLLILLTLFLTASGFTQIYQKLFDFNEVNGRLPYNTLISDGTYLYGMTFSGGVNEHGTIFKIKKDGTDFMKLHDFDATDGRKPRNSLTLIGSELYGVAQYGGTADQGVLFKINTNGSNFTKLLDFGTGTSTGLLPQSALYYDGTYFYGTTYGGGTGGGGMLYRIKPDGSDYSETFHFYNTNHQSISPEWDLAFDGTYFYGATYNGNSLDNSTIYKVKPDGTGYEKLHDFPDNVANTNVQPSDLLLYNNYLYGVTLYSETTQDGYLYRIKTDGTDFSILHNFDASTGNRPSCKLVAAGNYLYGTTYTGGTCCGVIFRIQPDGMDYSNVFDFSNSDGYDARCGLFFDGYTLYGVGASGGNTGNGVVFKFNDDNVTSVETLSNGTSFSLFPNPASSFLNINIEENTNIQIVDVLGNTIASHELCNGSNSIDISSLTAGIYLIQTDKGESIKFIKE